MPAELTVDLDEIPKSVAIRKVLGGREIALFRMGDEVFAIDAVCPHRRGPLDSGDLDEEGIVTCPWHGWRFDIRTGKSPTHPGQVLTYPVRREGGRVIVSIGS